ncbi:thioester dehydrase [Gallaecimonas kandeliae]|uniref:ApeI family dehydratase n=1 Tax=Gallaecimonas kandeliae TaxID=3029055 RepID=UPI00264A17F1|nr:thioester dehydrase [Gallaecimonas kandeliae]WKE63997.1 thioester dehydrase [Gallaecimonas kandeliae]
MSLLPKILERRQQAQRLELVLDMDPGLTVFQGHFPGAPIVPGVAQLDWAIRLGAAHFGLALASQRLEAIKFQRLITPGLPLTLTLEYHQDKGKLHFQYDSEHGCHGSGRVLLAEEGP